ncbi:MAG: S9 family peptidase [Bacteroidales bacterium]|jgi:dipeptidyl-peptidase-4|nr:S9 family peptidase [Bacteroidales bacterium]
MKNFFIIFLLIFINFISFSQTDKVLTIDEAVVGLSRELYPEYISGLKFCPNNNEISYLQDNSLMVKNFKYKKNNLTEKSIISLDELNEIITKYDFKELKSFPQYQWMTNYFIRIRLGLSILDIDISLKKIVNSITIGEEHENITFANNKYDYAYTIGGNLFLKNLKSESKQITADGDKGIVYGQTVSRNEFGIDGGIFWSPKDNFIAFYRKDESQVTEYPIVNTNTRIATLDNIKYPMAGMPSEEITIGVYNINTMETIFLNTEGDKNQYLTSVTWSPDEKNIYVALLNREQNHLKLNCYDAVSGKLFKTLFEEKNDKYVEPQDALIFLPNDNSKFIWQSRKDGFSHLYLYDVNGNQISQLTKGEFEIQQVYGFSEKSDAIFIKANKESPIDFDIYKVNIKNQIMTKISSEKGSHNAIFSFDYQYFIDNFSNTTTPNKYVLCFTDGKKIDDLLISKNPLADYNMPDLKIGIIKANDGKTDLYYRLITPKNLDKSKKYPCIVYVYGGPHNQLISNRWLAGAAGWDYYMAQKGYIVFSLDNRGSSNRGFEFESIIHRQVGTVECQDQISGVDFLKTLGYVDMDRIGVHGWSYGGFITTTLMTDYSDIFKVGVAGGPVINWELYEVMYGERYMDTPEENPTGYQNSNLLNKAEKLKGRLMIIHGAIDPVVVWQNSQNFLDECIKNKVLIDYFIYPSHEHNVRGTDRIHLMRTVTRYFEDNL